MGDYRPELIPDDWLWAEYWTRYFTDQQPQHTWVVEDSASGQIGGYLTGTCDVHRARAYTPRLMPGMVWHVIRHRLMRRRASRQAIISMLRSLFLDPADLPHVLARRYPATWHFDLLPPARQAGVGGHLYRRFLRAMHELEVPGIHGQILSLNTAMRQFLSRMGFSLAYTSPTSAFRHITSEPVEIQTWVKDLSTRK